MKITSGLTPILRRVGHAFSALLFFSILLSNITIAGNDSIAKPISKQKQIVYKFDIKEPIGPAAWRQTQAAFEQAEENKSDYILIHMNTYGGAVDAADNIRTKILKSKIPVLVFIDNNAASAGALIAIACDSIYMSAGANMGAATVVDQEGTPQPEKYQSYMRSILRSTAEESGRDPKIAEAMNDSRVYIEGVNDSGKVLTFTASEAIKNQYCQGEAESIEQVLKLANINNYEIIEYKKTSIESIIDFLLNPALSGILIMIIIGGIYFELQAPGFGFPSVAAIIAALLYFAPHYLQGLASNWEMLLFVVGVLLLLVEIFVIPGFGFIGVSGIVCMVLGLSLSLVGAIPSDSPIDLPNGNQFLESISLVSLSILISLVLSIIIGRRFIKSSMFSKLALQATQKSSQGYVAADISEKALVGKTGTASTVMLPAGKVEIEGEIYDATAQTGFIEKGEAIIVTRFEGAQLVVRKV